MHHASWIRLRLISTKFTSYLNEKFGTLDVRYKRDRVINSKPTCPVAMSQEGRDSPSSTTPHRQVDDEVKLSSGQVVREVNEFPLVPSFTQILKGPLNGLDLKGLGLNID
jgi:hypothetical protein